MSRSIFGKVFGGGYPPPDVPQNKKWTENNNYIDKKILNNLLIDNKELSEKVKLLYEEIYK